MSKTIKKPLKNEEEIEELTDGVNWPVVIPLLVIMGGIIIAAFAFVLI